MFSRHDEFGFILKEEGILVVISIYVFIKIRYIGKLSHYVTPLRRLSLRFEQQSPEPGKVTNAILRELAQNTKSKQFPGEILFYYL